jgi:hypothetical protein
MMHHALWLRPLATRGDPVLLLCYICTGVTRNSVTEISIFLESKSVLCIDDTLDLSCVTPIVLPTSHRRPFIVETNQLPTNVVRDGLAQFGKMNVDLSEQG